MKKPNDKIETPRVPDYIRVQLAGGRTDFYPISDFSEKQLRDLVKEWSKELLQNRKNIIKRHKKNEL